MNDVMGTEVVVDGAVVEVGDGDVVDAVDCVAVVGAVADAVDDSGGHVVVEAVGDAVGEEVCSSAIEEVGSDVVDEVALVDNVVVDDDDDDVDANAAAVAVVVASVCRLTSLAVDEAKPPDVEVDPADDLLVSVVLPKLPAVVVDVSSIVVVVEDSATSLVSPIGVDV